MSIWVRTRRHTAHEGRVYLCSLSRDHGSSELMRHSTTRAALLALVMRHATGTHRMASDTWMSHAGRMPREIWAHTGCHHDCEVRSIIHVVDIDNRVVVLSHTLNGGQDNAG
jgi:hypothetical protein